MTKELLQQELEKKNIPYDKRWGEAKLKLALSDTTEVKKEDTPEIPDEQRDKYDQMEALGLTQFDSNVKVGDNNIVKELRENALVGREIWQNKKKKAVVLKEAGKMYRKVHKDDSVEIYEDKSGRYIREYSLKVHGSGYEKLADLFIKGRIEKGMGQPRSRSISGIIKPRPII